MAFITPAELSKVRAERVQGEIERILESYREIITTHSPAEDGSWKVSAGSLGSFSNTERGVIRKSLEAELNNSGWDFEESYGIYAYIIRPKV